MFGDDKVEDIYQGRLSAWPKLFLSLLRIFVQEKYCPVLVAGMRSVWKHKLGQHAVVGVSRIRELAIWIVRPIELVTLTARHRLLGLDIGIPSWTLCRWRIRRPECSPHVAGWPKDLQGLRQCH